jgi:arylformamidase
MKLFDISQEVFRGQVYPGDLVPSYEVVSDISQGDHYNLSNITMCVHNGTHMDAPSHYIPDGKTIDKIDLTKCIGQVEVVEAHGEISADEIKELLKKDKNEIISRVLFKGKCYVSLEAAREINKNQMVLVGVEAQSIETDDSLSLVHKELLSKEVILLEGIHLGNVPTGRYTLYATPLKLGGLEGSPCRAVIIAE